MQKSRTTSRDLSCSDMCNMVQHSCLSGIHPYIREMLELKNTILLQEALRAADDAVQSNSLLVFSKFKRSVSQIPALSNRYSTSHVMECSEKSPKIAADPEC